MATNDPLCLKSHLASIHLSIMMSPASCCSCTVQNTCNKEIKRQLATATIFFHEHSQFTEHQRKGEAFSLTTFYLLHSFHRRHLDISHMITADCSPPHILKPETLNFECKLLTTNLALLMQVVLMISVLIFSLCNCVGRNFVLS